MDPKIYEKSDYRSFWTGAGKEYLDKLEKAIIRESLPGGDSIAEIGAGYGRLTGAICKVHFVEPAQNLRKIAAETYGNKVFYHDADVYRLPFSDSSLDA